jgi:uncharacterized 2Fe-2S/4Fe-4S cluster protein (DUF4445 family)
MTSIIFYPYGKEAHPDGRQSLLQLAGNLNLPLQGLCRGRKKCGKCRVVIEAGDGPLPPPTDRERDILGDQTDQGVRLACETVLTDGAHVRILEESPGQKPLILTAQSGQKLYLKLAPPVEAFYVEIPEPLLNPPLGDAERLLAALESTYDLSLRLTDLHLLRILPRTLRTSKGLTALVRNRDEIIGLNPEKPSSLCGMAFDIGTTTVVGYLFDLFNGRELAVLSALNPQVPFGVDVISRLSYCRENPEGLEKLRLLILQCLNDLITEAADSAKIDLNHIVEVTLVGNTVMHHLWTGLDPAFLAASPYPPVLQRHQDFKAGELGLHIHPSGYAHLLPLKAGFVGSDIIAGILASRLHKQKRLTLFMDLGTNGEIVLGHKDRLICCSTAAGPAFEGGHIRHGMRAAQGAIDRVKIEPGNFDVHWRTIHEAPPAGLCGSGIISAVAEMVRRGILLANGHFNPEVNSRRLRNGSHGPEFVLVWAEETAHGQDILLTKKDVSEVQLAKAAIFAGIELLRGKWGGEPVQQLFLAGAFGNYIDLEDAVTIDLIPKELKRWVMLGNAAGSGACLTLLNRNKRKEADRIARNMGVLELAAQPRFQELFVSGLFFRSALDYSDNY